jgi:hypothetical protein
MTFGMIGSRQSLYKWDLISGSIVKPPAVLLPSSIPLTLILLAIVAEPRVVLEGDFELRVEGSA